MVEGETQVGFTYHYIDEDWDNGDIIIQESEPVEPFDLQATLFQRVMVKSMDRFMDAFRHVASGTAGSPQQGEASYFRRGAPFGGTIDPMWPDDKIERFIRAMNHPPYPPAQFAGIPVNTFDEYVTLRKSLTQLQGTCA
jgi:methionyl-tRNA formyltransferase